MLKGSFICISFNMSEVVQLLMFKDYLLFFSVDCLLLSFAQFSIKFLVYYCDKISEIN